MADDEVSGPEVELPRGIALAWGVAANPQRGPKREMSIERIVDTAVAIADAEGLGAVSMSAVAAALGFTPMSLYRYVSAKDDLVLLMQEEAIGLPADELREIDGWRPRLAALHRSMVGIYVEHPWVLEVPITGSPMTPHSCAWLDAMLGALDATPLDAQERLGVALLVTGHARWTGAILAVYVNAARVQGITAEEVARREDALFRMLISADDFPALHAAVAAGAVGDTSDPFAFGTDRILDGVAAHIDAAGAGGVRGVPAPWPDDEPPAVLADKRYREARKAARDAEKQLRVARRAERQALREARERVARQSPA